MINWIAWNRNLLTFKLSTYAEVNIWNKTVWYLTLCIAQSAGAEEYIDYPFAEG